MDLGHSATSTRSLPQWLLEWEERQRRRLEHHEEAMRDVVEAMKKEMLEKLDRRERPLAGLKQPGPPRDAAKEEEKDRTLEAPMHDSGNGNLRSKFAASLESTAALRTENTCATRKFNNIPVDNMNQAMMDACGVTKAKFGQASSGTHTSRANEYIPRTLFQSAVYGIVRHRVFEVCSCILILLYTVAVGVMSDLDMRAAVDGLGTPQWCYFVDVSFTAIFLFEVCLRIIAEGTHYIMGSQKKWNLFDILVAMAGLLDILTAFNVSLSFLRVLRALRAVRVLRVIRIFRFFKQLRMMVASILCCLSSLTWAFLLLAAVMYMFAVVLLQGASDFLHSADSHPPTKLYGSLSTDFGDMGKTIFSLTQAISGGRSWGEYANPFVDISPWYGVGFTMFMVFVIFGMLNILTGIFVENTSMVANFDKELVIQEEMSRNESVINQIRQLFMEIDVDKSGKLSMEELKANLNDNRVKAYFSTLQMDVTEAAGLFHLLDSDESGEVSIDEFIMTCMKLKGTARSIDLVTMLFDNKRLYKMIRSFMRHVDASLGEVQSKIVALQCSHDELVFAVS